MYKIKKGEDVTILLKARLVLHGHRNDEKDIIRKYSAASDLLLIRLIISFYTVMNFLIAAADVKGTHMQSGPPSAKFMFFHLPDERKTLWHSISLPNVIIEAGRQRGRTAQDWMTQEEILKGLHGSVQIISKRYNQNRLQLVVTRTVDDVIAIGKMEELNIFMDKLCQRLEIGLVSYLTIIKFNGCIITKTDEPVTISMDDDYLNRLEPLEL